jgi:hypothetical protein
VSYTSFSIGRPGRAYDGVAMGSDQWNALITRQFEILGEGNAETIVGGFAAGIGKFINVNTYPDVESSSRVIARLAAEQLFEVESSGPFVSTEDMMKLMAS